MATIKIIFAYILHIIKTVAIIQLKNFGSINTPNRIAKVFVFILATASVLGILFFFYNMIVVEELQVMMDLEMNNGYIHEPKTIVSSVLSSQIGNRFIEICKDEMTIIFG